MGTIVLEILAFLSVIFLIGILLYFGTLQEEKA